MSKFKKIISIIMAMAIIFTTVAVATQSYAAEKSGYSMSSDMRAAIKDVYDDYNFTVGWGLYDISSGSLKEVASHNAGTTFQSNCTIKALMLLYICKLMDEGKLSKSTRLAVDNDVLHYGGLMNGKYRVDYLLKKLIRVSNSACFEVFHRYVGRENFNAFLKSLGSNTQMTSYSFMGRCTPRDRAVEWDAIYNYCHSDAKNADFAWNIYTTALYSPIRDGVHRTVAHKSGWYDKNGSGSSGDCAVVKTRNGGCYLVVIFAQNNGRGSYSNRLISRLASTLDDVWDEYYDSLSEKTYAPF